jgi:hypothetical protein
MPRKALSEALQVKAAAAALGLAILSGCGAVPNPYAGLPYLQSSACPDAPSPGEARTVVVLDWDGGLSVQAKGRELTAFDLAALTFNDGTITDSQTEELFRAAVLAKVQSLLCVLEPLDVAVIEGEADNFPGATVIHLTADDPGDGSKHIGQSHFDPCNEHGDDAGIIWVGALQRRIPRATFDQWVNAVGNTTAHEIGHTLGFTHPDEETLARSLPTPSQELMRGTVTIAALVGEQAFLLEQETCPGAAPGAGSYALILEGRAE